MPEVKARKQLTRFCALSTLNQNANLLKTRSTEAKLRIRAFVSLDWPLQHRNQDDDFKTLVWSYTKMINLKWYYLSDDYVIPIIFPW